MGENQEENAIVTSTGEYVVAWDFNKVKKGHLDKYHIKKCVLSTSILTPPHLAHGPYVSRYEDRVVQDNFKFGDDKEIVRLDPISAVHVTAPRWYSNADTPR